jgi:hypothetical protein
VFYRCRGFLIVLPLLAGHWGWIGRSFYEFLTVQRFDTAKTHSGHSQDTRAATQQTSSQPGRRRQ